MIWISLESDSNSPDDLPLVGMIFRATSCGTEVRALEGEGLSSVACLLAALLAPFVHLPERAFPYQL